MQRRAAPCICQNRFVCDYRLEMENETLRILTEKKIFLLERETEIKRC